MNMPRNPVGPARRNGAADSSPPSSPAGFFAWRHIRGVAPRGWEVSRFSVEDRVGRLEFADRDGLRATFSWEECRQEPDLRATMAAFLERNVMGRDKARRSGFRADAVDVSAEGAWSLGAMRGSGAAPLQALAWERAGGALLRWIFEPCAPGVPAAAHSAAVRELLRSCDFNDSPDCAEYALFGLRAALPRDWELEDVAAFPADVCFAFEHRRLRARAVFRRWGLARHRLPADGGAAALEAFWRDAMARECVVADACERRSFVFEGRRCDGLLVRFSAPRRYHDDRFMARRWRNGVARVWHVPERNAIFSFGDAGERDFPRLPVSAAPGLVEDR